MQLCPREVPEVQLASPGSRAPQSRAGFTPQPVSGQRAYSRTEGFGRGTGGSGKGKELSQTGSLSLHSAATFSE